MANIFKSIWNWFSTQETPAGPTPDQVLARICEILLSLDGQQKELHGRMTTLQHQMNLTHERQIAVLNKLDFMVRREEAQITQIEHRMDDAASHQGRPEEHTP